jgi:hypothetical protein
MISQKQIAELLMRHPRCHFIATVVLASIGTIAGKLAFHVSTPLSFLIPVSTRLSLITCFAVFAIGIGGAVYLLAILVDGNAPDPGHW